MVSFTTHNRFNPRKALQSFDVNSRSLRSAEDDLGARIDCAVVARQRQGLGVGVAHRCKAHDIGLR